MEKIKKIGRRKKSDLEFDELYPREPHPPSVTYKALQTPHGACWIIDGRCTDSDLINKNMLSLEVPRFSGTRLRLFDDVDFAIDWCSTWGFSSWNLAHNCNVQTHESSPWIWDAVKYNIAKLPETPNQITVIENNINRSNFAQSLNEVYWEAAQLIRIGNTDYSSVIKVIAHRLYDTKYILLPPRCNLDSLLTLEDLGFVQVPNGYGFTLFVNAKYPESLQSWSDRTDSSI